MARCVAQALAALEPLVIEAGTGTGKTFAYLVPALLRAARCTITGTRTLQDQLYHRDLPAVSAAIGRPVKIALLKGRANYLCRHRLQLGQIGARAAIARERWENSPADRRAGRARHAAATSAS